ncbi:MAG: aspartate carbamoyltransferase catalytic subunit [Firmicutes bacterium]|nr:aspartate carbamoyltransferase catalytic subunit [Bacillota bacterium]
MKKDLLGLKDISASEIELILDTAAEMKKLFSKKGKKSNLLEGQTVSTLFFENSTRTRLSFETASNFLGAHFMAISASTSSVSKGETFIDTGKNLDAILIDAIVIRHPMGGAPHLLAKNVKASVINGGDGTSEHPTQALLDFLTMREKFSKIKGLKVVLCGDIKFSRVARSNIWGLLKLGAEVTVCAPYTLLPKGMEDFGVKVELNPAKAIANADVIMGLRIQSERQNMGVFPSVGEYAKFFSITEEVIKKAKAEKAIIMHPGPANRGVEMSGEVLDSKNSVVLEQVTNGVAVRMAVLKLLLEARARGVKS